MLLRLHPAFYSKSSGIGETLVRGRAKTEHDLMKYARLLVQEEHRLTRLVNNLLAYARVTDVTEIYSFASQDPVTLVDEALQGFRRQLTERDFQLDVAVSPSASRNALCTMCVAVWDRLIERRRSTSTSDCARPPTETSPPSTRARCTISPLIGDCTS